MAKSSGNNGGDPDHLKHGVGLVVHQSEEVVQRKSEDSGGSRLSTLVDFEMIQSVQGDLSTAMKLTLLSIVAFHIIMPITIAILTGTLLVPTRSETDIRSVTIGFTFAAIYFEPLAIVLVMAMWNCITKSMRMWFFVLRLGLTITAAVLTRLDAETCFVVDIQGYMNPCYNITAVNALLFASVPLIAFEIAVVVQDPKEEREAKKEAKAEANAEANIVNPNIEI